MIYFLMNTSLNKLTLNYFKNISYGLLINVKMLEKCKVHI